MINAISSSNTSIYKNMKISFKGKSDVNYRNSNKNTKDEFIKNIEQEKVSVANWASNRIKKLDNILKAISEKDEMPKSEKARLAAADFHNDRMREALNSLESAGIKTSDCKEPSYYGGLTGNDKNILNNRVDSASNLSDAQKRDLHDKINRSYYEDSQQSFGQGDVTDPYTPDSSDTYIPDGGDGDSCDSGDSDCDSDCDGAECLSDTADCIS